MNRCILEIQAQRKQRNWIGVQFLRFHGAKAGEDTIGQHRLESMDNKLEHRFGSDIVDTPDWDDADVCFMRAVCVSRDDDKK